jgi:hypothetical protein
MLRELKQDILKTKLQSMKLIRKISRKKNVSKEEKKVFRNLLEMVEMHSPQQLEIWYLIVLI